MAGMSYSDYILSTAHKPWEDNLTLSESNRTASMGWRVGTPRPYSGQMHKRVYSRSVGDLTANPPSTESHTRLNSEFCLNLYKRYPRVFHKQFARSVGRKVFNPSARATFEEEEGFDDKQSVSSARSVKSERPLTNWDREVGEYFRHKSASRESLTSPALSEYSKTSGLSIKHRLQQNSEQLRQLLNDRPLLRREKALSDLALQNGGHNDSHKRHLSSLTDEKTRSWSNDRRIRQRKFQPNQKDFDSLRTNLEITALKNNFKTQHWQPNQSSNQHSEYSCHDVGDLYTTSQMSDTDFETGMQRENLRMLLVNQDSPPDSAIDVDTPSVRSLVSTDRTYSISALDAEQESSVFQVYSDIPKQLYENIEGMCKVENDNHSPDSITDCEQNGDQNFERLGEYCVTDDQEKTEDERLFNVNGYNSVPLIVPEEDTGASQIVHLDCSPDFSYEMQKLVNDFEASFNHLSIPSPVMETESLDYEMNVPEEEELERSETQLADQDSLTGQDSLTHQESLTGQENLTGQDTNDESNTVIDSDNSSSTDSSSVPSETLQDSTLILLESDIDIYDDVAVIKNPGITNEKANVDTNATSTEAQRIGTMPGFDSEDCANDLQISPDPSIELEMVAETQLEVYENLPMTRHEDDSILDEVNMLQELSANVLAKGGHSRTRVHFEDDTDDTNPELGIPKVLADEKEIAERYRRRRSPSPYCICNRHNTTKLRPQSTSLWSTVDVRGFDIVGGDDNIGFNCVSLQNSPGIKEDESSAQNTLKQSIQKTVYQSDDRDFKTGVTGHINVQPALISLMKIKHKLSKSYSDDSTFFQKDSPDSTNSQSSTHRPGQRSLSASSGSLCSESSFSNIEISREKDRMECSNVKYMENKSRQFKADEGKDRMECSNVKYMENKSRQFKADEGSEVSKRIHETDKATDEGCEEGFKIVQTEISQHTRTDSYSETKGHIDSRPPLNHSVVPNIKGKKGRYIPAITSPRHAKNKIKFRNLFKSKKGSYNPSWVVNSCNSDEGFETVTSNDAWNSTQGFDGNESTQNVNLTRSLAGAQSTESLHAVDPTYEMITSDQSKIEKTATASSCAVKHNSPVYKTQEQSITSLPKQVTPNESMKIVQKEVISDDIWTGKFSLYEAIENNEKLTDGAESSSFSAKLDMEDKNRRRTALMPYVDKVNDPDSSVEQIHVDVKVHTGLPSQEEEEDFNKYFPDIITDEDAAPQTNGSAIYAQVDHQNKMRTTRKSEDMSPPASTRGIDTRGGNFNDIDTDEFGPPLPDRNYHTSYLEKSRELSGSKLSLRKKISGLKNAAKIKFLSLRKSASMDKGIDAAGTEESTGAHKLPPKSSPSGTKKTPSSKTFKSIFGSKKKKADDSSDGEHKEVERYASVPAENPLPLQKRQQWSSCQELDSIQSPSEFQSLGKLLQLNPDGSQLIQLIRSSNEQLGFFIAKGNAKFNNGIFISRFCEQTPEKLFAGLIGVGDEILEINRAPVQGLPLESVYQIMRSCEKITMKILPLIARKDI